MTDSLCPDAMEIWHKHNLPKPGVSFWLISGNLLTSVFSFHVIQSECNLLQLSPPQQKLPGVLHGGALQGFYFLVVVTESVLQCSVSVTPGQNINIPSLNISESPCTNNYSSRPGTRSPHSHCHCASVMCQTQANFCFIINLLFALPHIQFSSMWKQSCLCLLSAIEKKQTMTRGK